MATGIQWTDETWNPVTGCSKVSPGCALSEPAESVPGRVVTGYETPWTALSVESRQRIAAAAATRDFWIVFAGLASSVWKARAVFHGVVKARWHDLDVLRSVVRLYTVQVMRNLASFQAATKLLFCHQPVLVNVAAHVGEMMPRHSQQHVAARRDRPSAFPIWIALSRMNDAHRFRVALQIEGGNG